MIIRTAATLIAAVAAVFVAQETLARSGGGFGPARVATPPAALHPAGRAAIRGHEFRARFRHHRRFGSAWPGVWDSGYYPYGGSYDPYSSYDPYYGGPYDSPPRYPASGYPIASTAPAAPRPIYVIPYRPGCESQTQKLPWRHGEERAITIVRC
jgi:hypothetical protein